MTRHSWLKNVMSPDELSITASYQIDKCKKCGCLLIHKYFGGIDYRKTYLINGRESQIRPECNIKNISDETPMD